MIIALMAEIGNKSKFHQKRGESMKKIKTADIIQRCIDDMAVIPAPPWWLSIVISVLAIVITVCKR